ncbi:SEC-C motif [Gaiella occulta]|uniref:SEC-C motif n=1 Tax=Gaiella occulta TaxID=1002870 RepID=A0A7M2YZ16_9ACTN|nr:SEC-C metal-binding domain-containing protein [Gaiella occulta]RDI75346.1 SEC-C motif [Gaiella occulta]
MFTYGRITRLLLSETGGKVEEFDDFYRRQLDLLTKLAQSKRDRNQISRNDQCPCGCGKKYKNCHGG